MSEITSERLYHLLPSIYRQRDLSQGEPLRALLAVVESELQLLEADIEGLYDNWFIETCEEWVVPYLGDLLGIRGLGDAKNIVISQRARVANALSALSRKGTAATLERMVRDTTGWQVKVVEFFEQLASTQYLRHVRPGKGTTFDVRQGTIGIDNPFDLAAHFPDVRRTAPAQGKYNLPNLGLFLWRLQIYPVMRSPAHAKVGPDHEPDGRYTFSPVDRDVHLFNRPQIENDFSRAVEAVNLPVPILLEAFKRDLDEYQARFAGLERDHWPSNSAYYGPERSLSIVRVDKDSDDIEHRTPILPMEVIAADLEDWVRPPGDKVAVDVRLGRIMFPANDIPSGHVEVSYHSGFSADLGGGPYDRRQTLADPGLDPITISKSGLVTTLQEALKVWENRGRPDAIIQITDNGVYGGGIEINLTNLDSPRQVVIQAADGVCPSVRLVGNLIVRSDRPETTLTLNGLLIEGGIEVRGAFQLGGNTLPDAPKVAVGMPGQNAREDAGFEQTRPQREMRPEVQCGLQLNIAHCTLTPGRMLDKDGKLASPDRDVLKVGKDTSQLGNQLGKLGIKVNITRSIVGPVRLPAQCEQLVIQDSIVDAPEVRGEIQPAIAADDGDPDPDHPILPKDGPPTSLERTTVFGPVYVKELTLASETIFTAPVYASMEKPVTGCVRYSYVPPGSVTPPRFRCQPDLALAQRAKDLNLKSTEPLTPAESDRVLTRVQPRFTSTHYGHPAYAQLALNCAQEIRTGGEESAEMGVFQHLFQPQRETNLRLVLEEYLRFGLDAGILYMT